MPGLFRVPTMLTTPPELAMAAQFENSEVLPFGSVAVAETKWDPPGENAVSTGAFCARFGPLAFT